MTTTSLPVIPTNSLSETDAATYAEWFSVLAEPMRVRMLYAIASSTQSSSVGALAEQLQISQSTASHHVRKLADVGFVTVTKRGTTSVVSVNPACCTGLPHAADVVMGALTPLPCCPADAPSDVEVRAMVDADWDDVRRIYAEGIATGDATFETEVPATEVLDRTWLDDHRWVAVVDDQVAGWAAIAPVSERASYAGVGESSVYVGEDLRGRGIGKALIYRQVTEADDCGLWMLQTSIFPENRPSLALHHSAGFRTLGVRDRIAQHHGRWRDTVLLERRRDDVRLSQDDSQATGEIPNA